MSESETVFAQCTVDRSLPGCVVLRMTGELDAFSAVKIEEQVASSVVAGSRKLVLDLAELEFIDSSGIRLLMQVISRKTPETEAILVYPQPGPARRALDIVGIGRVIRAVDTLYEAVAEQSSR